MMASEAVIFAQLVTDYCRFETIRVKQDANAVPECPEDLHYWANATRRMRWDHIAGWRASETGYNQSHGLTV